MKMILLSGGSGKRLWPLSNDIRSKQFLKLLKDEENNAESMVQRVYRQIREAKIDSDLVVATGKTQKESIESHLGDAVDIVLEPERRDTFPAIALATSYLYFEKDMREDEAVVVIPVDPFAESAYFQIVKDLQEVIESNKAKIGLMGIKPTYPSEKYGYILKEQNSEMVKGFREKPSAEDASSLIENGAVWNGGVFSFKAGYLIQILKKYIEFSSYEDVLHQYNLLPKISFDYEVLEKESSITMLEYDGMWKDLGTWNTLTEVMGEKVSGNALISETSSNTHVINELDIPVKVLGTTDLVVAASPDGILVSDKHESSYLKKYLGEEPKFPRYEEKSWGDAKVLDYSENHDGSTSLTKTLYIKAGEVLDNQKHTIRDEIWTIIDGSGDITIDGFTRNVSRGDVAYVRKGQEHCIKANTDMRLIEVQIGQEITDEDIQ